jgi:16S rRNA (cytosine1402-N4)-methyltransferase
MNEDTPVKLNPIHVPVMLRRVMQECRSLKANEITIIDCTMGDGGHSSKMYEHYIQPFPKRVLLSFDWDRESVSFVQKKFPAVTPIDSRKRYSKLPGQWVYVQQNFAYIGHTVRNLQPALPQVGIILMDLGISSRQLAQRQRGFSFQGNSVLDMRMDTETYAVTAYDLLNTLSIHKLTDMFVFTVGIRKPVAREMAKAIVSARDMQKFGNENDVKRVNAIASKILPIRKGAVGRLHPATLVFLALRIAVNTELQNLVEALPAATDLIGSHGKLLVMTYHSAEEKIVQNFIKENFLTVTKILPTKNEIARNPRARSAKLFIITKYEAASSERKKVFRSK